jgi:hypothetical protein
MPKILGNGLGKYNKSYSAPHQEYNKIEFAFFPNFLRFSRDFIRFDKSVILLKMFFCAGAPRSFSTFTTIPLVCTEHPRKNWGLAILPLAMGGGGAGRNPARPAALPVGETVGLVHVLTYDAGVAEVGADGSPVRARGGDQR